MNYGNGAAAIHITPESGQVCLSSPLAPKGAVENTQRVISSTLHVSSLQLHANKLGFLSFLGQ